MKKLSKIFLSFLFSVIALFGYANPLNILSTNWYNQYFPNLNYRPINDITFVDSLLGFAITGGEHTSGHINYFLKTVNGGDNWTITDSITGDLWRIIFLNKDTGYVCGWQQGVVGGYLAKTTNSGINWNKVQSASFGGFYDDMFILNKDTIYIADGSGFNGGVYRTTDGGVSWSQLYYSISSNPYKIYFVNKNLGFYCPSYWGGGPLFRTTNGGFNWTSLGSELGFTKMTFTDSLTGWKSSSPYMKKTTNGGLNWINQPLPNPSVGFIMGGMYNFSVLNKDTIWGVGAVYEFPNQRDFGVLYRTTNGGTNWYYQILDTSIIKMAGYEFIYFYNKKVAWAYSQTKGIHTINGGDTTFISNINNQITNNVANEFILYQNYPNPFNAVTSIKYEVKRRADIKLVVYDIRGKEIETLINEKQKTEEYSIKFDASNLSSGIYFYSLFTDGVNVSTKKMVLLK